MRYLRRRMSSNSLGKRIGWTIILFLLAFFSIMVIAYYFLPEGLLKNRNPLQNWETSDNNFVLIIQIFFFNLLSLIAISVGSLFGQKNELEENYFSTGYYIFFTMVLINGITLGTWSFSVESDPVPLLDRIIRTFDLVHRAGLWEMLGQLLVTCSLAHIAVVLTNGSSTITRNVKDISLTKSERSIFILGIVLMLIGAVVETFAINLV